MAIDPSIIAAAGLGLVGGVVAYGVFAPRSGLFGEVVARGDGSARRVALTFDDGPWPGETERILDLLGEHGARATFFVIGRYAAAHPRLVERIYREGHQIGNHTYDHSRAGLLRFWGYWRAQLTRTDEAIASIIGARPAVFRAPMGFKSPPVMAAARNLGYATIAWSRRAYDGVASSPDQIEQAVLQRGGGIRAGEIVLMHDGRDPASDRPIGATSSALPRILSGLRERGLDAVRLDALLTGGSDAAGR